MGKLVIQRDVSQQLLDWKRPPGRKPLILKASGRREKPVCCKTSVKHTTETAYFNFEEQPELAQFFTAGKDAQRILQNLSLVHGRAIKAGQTLIVLDEIQECNEALNALKYFCENAPDYHVAAAGSLLGITLSRGASFPIGKVDFLNVQPLSQNFSSLLIPIWPPISNAWRSWRRFRIFFSAG